jgi:hypothetical protein
MGCGYILVTGVPEMERPKTPLQGYRFINVDAVRTTVCFLFLEPVNNAMQLCAHLQGNL